MKAQVLVLAVLVHAGPALAQAPAAAAPPAPTPAPPAAPAARVLPLDEALRIGFSRQPALRQAQAGTEAARARTGQALAPLLPQVSGTASYDRSNDVTDASFAGLTSSSAREIYTARLNGRLLVWDFGQTWGRFRAAQAAESGQEASERGTRQGVAFDIRSAYFDAVASKALVGVARDTLANEERHLEQIRAFVEVGTRPPIDLVSERSNLANARVRLIQAENGYATSRVRVEQAIGAPDLGPWEVEQSGIAPLPGEDAAPEVLLAEAIAARPDLVALERQVHAQELTVRAIQGGYGPSLGVSAGVGKVGARPNELDQTWTTSVTLTWPLFQGGLTGAQAREARANETALRAQVDQFKQAVRLEVEQARLGVRAGIATLGASEEAAQAARERLALAEGRYQTGVGSVLELADAQVALTTALGQRVQAEFQLATARSQLLRALGRP